MLKNISVSSKLWLIVLPAIAALVGLLILFVTSSYDIESRSKKVLFDQVYLPTEMILSADRDFHMASAAEKEMTLSEWLTADDMKSLLITFNTAVDSVKEHMSAAMDKLKADQDLYKNFRDSKNNQSLEQLFTSYQSDFAHWQETYDNTKGTGNMTEHQAAFTKARDDIRLMADVLESYAESQSAQLHSSVQRSVQTSVLIISVVIVSVVIFSVLIITYIRGSLRYITQVNKHIAAGELSMQIDSKRKTRDEIGSLCTSTGHILNQLNTYKDYIDEIAMTLTAMSRGDMRIRLAHDYAGHFSTIKDAFSAISESLGGTLTTIKTASEQVHQGATLIASEAQALASGATEQASAVEQLTSSIMAVADVAEKNADGIKEAADNLKDTLQRIEESNAQMIQMLGSMSAISETSNVIKTVIKLIDDIAFQTNILALNAAVEAARAGSYGRGFAIVAAEVKNLAMKSAEAAKQTEELIGSSINSVNAGLRNAQGAADILEEVARKVTDIDVVFHDIAEASCGQSRSMNEIKTGIEQIAVVVMMNTASSEESASAGEELSGQAELLHSEVSRFVVET